MTAIQTNHLKILWQTKEREEKNQKENRKSLCVTLKQFIDSLIGKGDEEKEGCWWAKKIKHWCFHNNY